MIALTDESCKTCGIGKDTLRKQLLKNKVDVYDCGSMTGAYPDEIYGAEECIYLADFATPLQYQLDRIASMKKLRRCFIILLGGLSQGTAVVGSWYLALKKLSCVCTVLSEDADSLDAALDRIAKLPPSDRTHVIIASRRGGTGRKTLAGLLRDAHPDTEFVCPQTGELPTEPFAAKHILIVGIRPDDFLLPPPEDGINRVTLVCTKANENVSDFIGREAYYGRITDTLIRSGWSLGRYFGEIYSTDLLYEKYRKRFSEKEISLSELEGDSGFFMWDSFGLPLPRTEYTADNVSAFLAQFCVTDTISDILDKGEHK